MQYESITIEPSQLNEFLTDNENTLILAVSPSCNTSSRTGSYHAILLYRQHKMLITGDLQDIASANRCALHGFIDAAGHITKCENVILLVAGSFGFKTAIKHKGPNSDLWNELFFIIESKGCNCITEVIVSGGGTQLSSLCK